MIWIVDQPLPPDPCVTVGVKSPKPVVVTEVTPVTKVFNQLYAGVADVKEDGVAVESYVVKAPLVMAITSTHS